MMAENLVLFLLLVTSYLVSKVVPRRELSLFSLLLSTAMMLPPIYHRIQLIKRVQLIPTKGAKLLQDLELTPDPPTQWKWETRRKPPTS